ncbi:MAG: endoglucanase, partial [Methanobrevibacter sp.]|nr:endoglucanase [Methanobrevibacter sp.]
MPNDKQKLLNIMRSLDNDYKAGKLSPERYRYFKAKYQERLNDLNKYEATNRIRSMQGKGKPYPNKRRRKVRKRSLDERNKEKNDLVQKYIINPKKGDKQFNKKVKESKDSGTNKLLIVLILIIAFTIGISVGIFAFDFNSMSVVNSDGIVLDTSFPDTGNVTLNETNTTNTSTVKHTTQNSSG